MEDIKKHFGEWDKEKCWDIVEIRPIKINVKKHWTGYGFTLSPEALSMRYETFRELHMGHKHHDIKVSGTTYDYETGEGLFYADSMDDIAKWVSLYTNIVYK